MSSNQRVFLGRSFAAIVAAFFLFSIPCSAAEAQLWNVNFGAGSKVGLAVAGNSTNDVWNLVEASGYATTTNLVLANGTNTSISITISNLANTGYIDLPDAMLGSYIGSQGYNGELSEEMPARMVISNLMAGTYTFYCYGFGQDPYYESDTFTIAVGTNTYGPKSTVFYGGFDPTTEPLTENYQYVILTNVVVGTNQVVYLTLNSMGYHAVNGLQIISVDTTPTLPAVEFDPVSGTGTPVSVTLAVPGHSTGTTIYYTTNGTTPTTGSYVYSSVLSFEAATTIKAFATKSGHNPSAVTTAMYPLSQLPLVTFNPTDGAGLPTNVVLAVPGHGGATIYFTTNGTTPTTGSLVYSSPIALNTNGWNYSANVVPAMTSFTTPLGSLVTNSTVLASSGDYGWKAFDHSYSTFWTANGPGPEWVSIEFASSRRVAKYAVISTVDGDAPKDWTLEGWNGSSYVVVDTRGSETNWAGLERREYVSTNSAPYPKYRLNISAANATSVNTGAYVRVGEVEMYEASVIIQAFAVKTNWIDSNVSYANYHARPQDQQQVAPTPLVSPGGGTFNNDQNVTISSSLSGASYEYTTNGTDWVSYSGAFTLNRNTTLRAKTLKTGYGGSLERTNSFSFVVATPTITPNGGMHTNGTDVALSTSTSGATLEYKIGTGSWVTYTGQFEITNTTLLTVVGSKSNYGSITNTASFTNFPGLLLNIDFGSFSGVSEKVGPAVIGLDSGDYWNAFSGDFAIPSLLVPPTSSYSNYVELIWSYPGSSLFYSDGTEATNKIVYSMYSPNRGELLHSDDMYKSYVEASDLYAPFFSGSRATVSLSDFSAGVYDICFYVHGTGEGTRARVGALSKRGGAKTTLRILEEATIDQQNSFVENVHYIKVSLVFPSDGWVIWGDVFGTNQCGIHGMQIFKRTTMPSVDFLPGSGTEVPTNVVIYVAGHPDAVIYYTLDGSIPTTNSAVYASPISVTSATTVKAFARKTRYPDTEVEEASYIEPLLPASVISPNGGVFTNSVTVAITNQVEDAVTEYRIGNSGSWHLYAAPFVLDGIATGSNFLSIRTSKDNMTNYLTSGTFVFTNSSPLITPAAGTYYIPFTVEIETILESQTVLYSTNGTFWYLYEGPLEFTDDVVMRVRATRPGYLDSATVTNSYVVDSFLVPVTTVCPDGGTYTNAMTVTFSNSAAGVLIEYRVGRSHEWQVYTAPFVLDGIDYGTGVLNVRASKGISITNYVTSEMFTFLTSAPIYSQTNSHHTNSFVLTMTNSTAGAETFYSLDAVKWQPYSSVLSISNATTVYARTVKEGYVSSGHVGHQAAAAFDGMQGLDNWFYRYASEVGGLPDSLLSLYDSTNWLWRVDGYRGCSVGWFGQTPDAQGDSVRSFKAPYAGAVKVEGLAFHEDVHSGGNVRARVLMNSDTLVDWADVGFSSVVMLQTETNLAVNDVLHFQVGVDYTEASLTLNLNPIVTFQHYRTFTFTDADGDGISDAVEIALGTDPNDADSDNDGLSDYWERRVGRNPLVAGVVEDVSDDLLLRIYTPLE